MLGFRKALRKDEAGTQEIRKYPRWVNPTGDDRDLEAGQMRQRGGANSNEKFHQTQECGAGHRDGKRELTGGNCGKRQGRQNFTQG